MNNFIKAYFLTVIIVDILTFCIFLAIFSFSDFFYDDGLLEVIDALIDPLITISFYYFILLLVVALPFFVVIKKFTQFSAFFAALSGLLVHCAYLAWDLWSNGAMDSMVLMVFLAAALAFSVVFTLCYSWFKKGEKPIPAKLDRVFK